MIGGGLWHVKDGNVGRLTAGSTLEFSGTVVAERSSVTFENDVRVLLSDDAGFSGGGNLGDSFILLGGALTQVGTTSEAQQRGSNVVLTINSVTLAGSGKLGDEFTDLATLGGGQIHVRTGDELTIGAWSFNNNGEVIVGQGRSTSPAARPISPTSRSVVAPLRSTAHRRLRTWAVISSCSAAASIASPMCSISRGSRSTTVVALPSEDRSRKMWA